MSDRLPSNSSDEETGDTPHNPAGHAVDPRDELMPSEPSHLTVRRAILYHRHEGRAPVAMSDEAGRSLRPPEWTDVTDQDESGGADAERQWIILYPEDYATHMVDAEDNLAILVDEDQARELRRLAERAIEKQTTGDVDDG